MLVNRRMPKLSAAMIGFLIEHVLMMVLTFLLTWFYFESF